MGALINSNPNCDTFGIVTKSFIVCFFVFFYTTLFQQLEIAVSINIGTIIILGDHIYNAWS